MTPEQIAAIRADNDYYTIPVTETRERVEELLAEVERLEGLVAVAEAFIEGMTRQQYVLTDRAERLTRALELIAGETEKGARHGWAPQVLVNRIARDVLDALEEPPCG